MHAQRLAVQDCLLRNTGTFDYLAFLDKDEFIIPRTNNTLKEVLKELQNTHELNERNSYQFKEAHFCPDLQKNLGNFYIFMTTSCSYNITFELAKCLQDIINCTASSFSLV